MHLDSSCELHPITKLQGRSVRISSIGPMSLCESHEVQQGKVQGPACESGQPPLSIQAGGWGDWENPCQEGLGGYWWMKSLTWATNVRSQPRRPTVSWAASREAWPAGPGTFTTFLVKFNKPEAMAYADWNMKLHKTVKLKYFLFC